MLIKHKEKRGKIEKKILLELQMNLIFLGKIIFIKNLLYFRIYNDFEADNQNDNSSIGKKINSQNPILNAYHILSELDDILKTGS